MASVSTWTSEDDELLKNAIQAGMSLESLSKGAVEFSQTFTLQELKDRWHSYTYCDHSSVEPSRHNVECAHLESGLKRKMNDDATDFHNHMLRRVRNSVVENRDNTRSTVSNCQSVCQHLPNFETATATAASNVFESCKSEEAEPEAGEQPSEMPIFWQNDPFYFEADTFFEFNHETSLTYNDIDIGDFQDSFMLPHIQTQNTYESISELALPERQDEEKESATNSADFHNTGVANDYEFLGCDVDSNSIDEIPFHNMENITPSTERNLAGSSPTLMDMQDLEEFFFTDIDGNDTANIPDLDSFLLECCCDLAGSPAPAANSSEYHIACPLQDHLSVPPASSVVYTSCVSEAQIFPSKPNADPDLSELCNGIICCVLNTEDTEIPCNDDALFTLSSDTEIPCNDDALFTLSSDTEIPCNGDALFTLSSHHQSGSSKRKNQLRGIKAFYLAESMKEKPDSSPTIPSKGALYKTETNKENPHLSRTIQSETASSPAENVKVNSDSSEMIQSDILSELGINLPFIKRGG